VCVCVCVCGIGARTQGFVLASQMPYQLNHPISPFFVISFEI
jgi:hypothetical protein